MRPFRQTFQTLTGSALLRGLFAFGSAEAATRVIRLGALLIAESLNKAQSLGWGRVMLVGDPPYYSRFGFWKLDGVEMPPPTNPDRVQGLELTEGAWEGISGPVVRDIDG